MSGSSRSAKKKVASTEINEVLDLTEDLTPEQEDFSNRVNELAVAMDGIISIAQVPNLIAVNALSILLRHAAAQLYSSAHGRPDLHEAIADDIEPDFFVLMDLISRKADFIVKAEQLRKVHRHQLPN